MKVRAEGQLLFNATAPMLAAALAGFGLAYPPEDDLLDYLAHGRLVRVLADWCSPIPAIICNAPAAASQRRRSAS